MTAEATNCPVCGQQVYRVPSGILMHTRGRRPKDLEVCPGSTRGARP